MDYEESEGWQARHFSSRHINHNRSGGKSSGGGGSGRGKGSSSGIFDPKRSYGMYEIACPALAKLSLGALVTSGISPEDLLDSPLSASLSSSPGSVFASSPVLASAGVAGGGSIATGKGKGKKGKGNSRRASKEDRIVAAVQGASDARFEIHGIVEGDGNEGAILCSFDLGGVIHGLAILAGSRRLLARVVAGLDGEDDDTADEDLEAESVASTAGGGDDDGYGSDEDGGRPALENGIEAADERERKRLAAFEKNSFRVPKFWMRWKGYVAANAGEALVGEQLQRSKSGRIVEANKGYIVFNGNDCSRFNGTFTCQTLGWKNVKITGSKLVSKTRECPMEWSDISVDGR